MVRQTESIDLSRSLQEGPARERRVEDSTYQPNVDKVPYPLWY